MDGTAADWMIVPADYPELSLLVWNRDAKRPIPAAEVFALYERNWRHVHKAGIQPVEAALIQRLTDHFGQGRILTR